MKNNNIEKLLNKNIERISKKLRNNKRASERVTARFLGVSQMLLLYTTPTGSRAGTGTFLTPRRGCGGGFAWFSPVSAQSGTTGIPSAWQPSPTIAWTTPSRKEVYCNASSI